MSVTIYHNPRCSKSRETLALLEAHAVQPNIVEYLKNPLDSAQISVLVKQLGFSSVRQLMRSKEDIYKQLDLKSQDDEQQLIAAVVAHPKLMERPIVVKGTKAAIGRPPENVLSIL
ncbi:arsenate reductase (glutaredoxin) [Pseudoalteromonas mariniglutinosa]|uniref:arsenate reductase (glutaredoxin) n=1 Tax=Pseudoalteromonas mariniglutinosa TaxID=206042 RepID=UPI0038504F8A